MGPKQPPTVLSGAGAACAVVSWQTPPLDDRLYVLQATIPGFDAFLHCIIAAFSGSMSASLPGIQTSLPRPHSSSTSNRYFTIVYWLRYATYRRIWFGRH